MSGVDQKLYFIALVPPEPIFTEVEELRTYFSHHFESSAALKSPPHITLHMPFWLKAGKESLLIEQLEKITKERINCRLKNLVNLMSCDIDVN